MSRQTKQQQIDELRERLDDAVLAAGVERARMMGMRARAARVTAVIWWAPAGTMSDRAGYAFDLVAGNHITVASSTRVWPTPGQAKRAALAVSPGATVKMPPRRKRGA